jgi:opacity protein-like surface antigen
MRRLPVALAALLTLTLAAALAAAGLSSTPSAQAQEQTEEFVFIDNFGVDPDAGGYVTLDARGSGFESMALQCAGAYPQSGTTQIPAQVVTRQPEPLLFRVRIFNNKGFVVVNPVRVNCTVDIVAPVSASTTQARQTLQRVAARQVALGR